MWKVLKERPALESFVLVANNDALEFFRCDETWYTRKSRLEDVLDELEEKVNLDRERDMVMKDQDLLKYGTSLSEDQLHPQSSHFYDNIEDIDQVTLVE